MRVSFLCCPFRTSFGAYGNSLKSAIEAKTGSKVQWVASNCGCGDPVEAGRQFLTKECDYFDMPIPSDFRSNQMWKRRVRGTARTMMLYLRARKYESMLDHPDVSHFQQVLNGYGSKVLFNWLKQPTTSARDRTMMLYLRARKYESMLDHPDVSHFQQVLNGYGSKVLFNWLKQPTTSA